MKCVYTVRDVKGVYLPPFSEPSRGDAIRKFELTVNSDQESLLSKFPHDYRLIEIANFDEETGQMVLLERPVDLGSGADFVRKKPEMKAV